MKILVRTYMRLNVGDDLFLHTLFTRYPNIHFQIQIQAPEEFCEKYIKFISSYHNVTAITNHGFVWRIKNKLKILDFDKAGLSTFDAVVYIGGSIFMENKENKEHDILQEKEIKFLYKHHIPIYFLSCNFGPYYTQEYRNSKEEIFKKCADVCFREKYSYEMFKHIPIVRYSPDAVFTSNIPDVNRKPKTLGIIMVNLENRPQLRELNNQYMQILIDIVKYYSKKGYNICFYSFCEFEDDKNTIDAFIQQIKQLGITENISSIIYNGDLLGFIEKYLSMECIVTSRFHGMVLSIISKQPVLPLVVSKKVTNTINDLNLCQNYIDLNKTDNDYTMNKPIDTTKIQQDAQGIFRELDRYINENIK